MRGLYILVVVSILLAAFQATAKEEVMDGYTHQQLMQLGETIYRKGILPSGKPVKALVMGDIPFDGRMFTCDDCHQRSGLGSEEGTIITWPTNGKELFAPRRRTGAYRPPRQSSARVDGRKQLPSYYQMEDVRPAYTDKSLARVLRAGIDPAGRRLDPVMPKYRLGDRNMRILVYYLKHLSVQMAPGVDDRFLQFATIITDDVSEQDRDAMLSVLRAHIDAHNSQGRHEKRRAAAGPFYKSERHQAYRELKLHVWRLQGPEAGWRDQLEEYYAKQPVFALLGGITGGSWQEIHRFSEEHKIPCIMPITDLPAISESDWYTLYFSKGLYQEGETSAKYVRAALKNEKDLRVVQLIQHGNRRSVAAAKGFEQTWKSMGLGKVDNFLVSSDGAVADRQLEELLSGPGSVVFLLWLDGRNPEIFNGLAARAGEKAILFASASLLESDFSHLARGVRERLLFTYPYCLPTEKMPTRSSVERWLELRKIPLTNFNIQAKMYFLGWMLPGSLKNLRSEFFREYFLEGYDMMIDQDYSIAVYPRLTFGSGQRYASKGCYITRLKEGSASELLPLSSWVTH